MKKVFNNPIFLSLAAKSALTILIVALANANS
ncbi:Uncharacterised protein [Streptococcus mutans]|uniref:Uncharacterized protein n=1 Tax=Streptococcus ratti FA-1 = DSM 20564 TaxID=699248 RepID=A0ABP2QY14_STRRT|nr:hypothetical protein SRA_05481 [Streptococcus ratti FA-1 = DSM 20564]VEI60273.1 Uncharacterised protein [Streptococcus mutans]